MLVDTHCHLDFDQFDQDRDEVMARAVEMGVKRIVVPAIDLHNCRTVIELAERYREVYAAVGVHPNSCADWRVEWLDELREFAKHERVVAIGEIGLDYYRNKAPRSIQNTAMQAQLDLASELGLPVIVHNRNSDADVLRNLSRARDTGRPLRGVLHSFSGSLEVAEAALSMDFYLGFTGPITFKKADELRALVSALPLSSLLVETDAPFLSPQRFRGKRNEPAYVRYVAEKVAELHGLSVDHVALETTQNATKLFGESIA